MKNQIHSPFLAVLAGMALTATAHGQLFQDDFESYAPDTALDTSGPWDRISGVTAPATLLVLDEATDTPFGTPNQYFDFDDSSEAASIRAESADFAEAVGAVTTFTFDFNEPDTAGGSLIFGYGRDGEDLNNTGRRLAMNFNNGAVTGLSSTADNTYALDTANRIFVIFNDTDSPVTYNGGSNTVEAGTADIWLKPDGGTAVLAGTRNTYNAPDSAYFVGFRSYSSNLQRVLIDNVALYEGIAIPGTPTIASLSPEDDSSQVAVGTGLELSFDRAVAPGTGSITLKQSSDDAIVGTFDVTNPAEVVFAGSTVTIDLPTELVLSTGYYVEIDATAITNVLGDAFPGISGKTGWNFTTSSDSTPPSIVTLSPADNSPDVAIDVNLVATFDEVITAGAGNIVISNLTEGTTFATIDVTDATQVTIDGATLTIDPVDDLHEGRTYAVEIDAGAITDTTGNPFAGIIGTADWDFDTVADTTSPVLVSTTPANNAATASLTNDLVATFDEAILDGTGNITILNLSDDTTFATIPVGDAQVTIDGSTLTINPDTNLDPGKQYAVQIDATAIVDLSDNPFAGIVAPDVTTWNFTTTRLSSKDSIIGESEPEGAAVDYYANANNVQVGVGGPGGGRVNRNVVLGYTLPTLPEGQVPGSINFFFEITSARKQNLDTVPNLQVYVLDTEDPDASGTDFYNHGDDVSPDVALVGNTSAPVSGTSDNNYADDEQDRVFTLTGDALALVQSYYGDDHIPDRPEVFFRFGMDPGPAINTYVRYRIDLADHESGVEIESVSTTPPVITSTVPADDYTGAYEGTTFSVTFDRDIVIGAGEITIWNVTDDEMFEFVDVNDDFYVTASGPTLTIALDFPLDPATEYAIQLDAGVVEDARGNPFAGILAPDVTTWNFTTGIIVVGDNSGEDRIIGRVQSQSTTEPGYYSGGDGRIGIGGGTNARQDQNKILIFTLPELPVGTILSAATLNFQIEAARNHSGADPQLTAYLLDSADPSSTGTAFFYHGPGDPNPDVALIGSTNTSHPQEDGQIGFDPPLQENFVLSSEALALLQGFYGGDHIPDRAEDYIRFNLDNFLNDNGNPDVDLNGATFDRYFVGDEIGESTLDLVYAPDDGTGGNTFATWIAGFNVGDQTGVSDDPDGDGNDNGVENLFGTAPDESSEGLVMGAVNGGTFTFTHPQNSTPASDLTAAYTWTTDLATPFNADGATDGGGTTVTFATQANTPSAGMTTVTATITGTATDKLFVRVEATQN